MITSGDIKNLVLELGADLVGIAPVERFKNVPKGFHPKDIYEECKSVVVFAKRIPPNNILNGNKITYTHIVNVTLLEIDNIGLKACCKLEKKGVQTVLIPTDDPYDYWDSSISEGRGIISLKYAGELAGIGKIGKNTLLVNKKYGNMIYIGCFLINQEVETDIVLKESYCKDKCKVCIELCPQKALDGKTLNQALCRKHITKTNDKGFILKNCSNCRTLCPNCLGIFEGQDGDSI